MSRVFYFQFVILLAHSQIIPYPPLFKSSHCEKNDLGCVIGPKCLLKTRSSSDTGVMATRCCDENECESQFDSNSVTCYPSEVTYLEQKEICEGNGRYLCSINDLKGICIGTGCEYVDSFLCIFNIFIQIDS